MEEAFYAVGSLILEKLGTTREGIHAGISVARTGLLGPPQDACNELRTAWQCQCRDDVAPPTAASSLSHLRECARRAEVKCTGTKAELLRRLPLGVPPRLYARIREENAEDRRSSAVEDVHSRFAGFLPFDYDAYVSATSAKRAPYCLDDDILDELPAIRRKMHFGRSVLTTWFRITDVARVAMHLIRPQDHHHHHHHHEELHRILEDATTKEEDAVNEQHTRYANVLAAYEASGLTKPPDFERYPPPIAYDYIKVGRGSVEEVVASRKTATWFEARGIQWKEDSLDAPNDTTKQTFLAVFATRLDPAELPTAPAKVRSVRARWDSLRALVPGVPFFTSPSEQPITLRYLMGLTDCTQEIRKRTWWFRHVDTSARYTETSSWHACMRAAVDRLGTGAVRQALVSDKDGDLLDILHPLEELELRHRDHVARIQNAGGLKVRRIHGSEGDVVRVCVAAERDALVCPWCDKKLYPCSQKMRKKFNKHFWRHGARIVD